MGRILINQQPPHQTIDRVSKQGPQSRSVAPSPAQLWNLFILMLVDPDK